MSRYWFQAQEIIALTNNHLAFWFLVGRFKDYTPTPSPTCVYFWDRPRGVVTSTLRPPSILHRGRNVPRDGRRRPHGAIGHGPADFRPFPDAGSARVGRSDVSMPLLDSRRVSDGQAFRKLLRALVCTDHVSSSGVFFERIRARVGCVERDKNNICRISLARRGRKSERTTLPDAVCR